VNTNSGRRGPNNAEKQSHTKAQRGAPTQPFVRLFRGLRWRALSLLHKLTWAYRGLRWRLIGKIRKGQWFLRRRNRQVVRTYRRVATRLRRLARRCTAVATQFRRRGKRALRYRHGSHPNLRNRDLAELGRDANQAFEHVCQIAGLPTSRSGIRGTLDRSKARRRLFLPIQPTDTATSQCADLERCNSWSSAVQRKVAEARIIVCQEPTESELSRWLMFIIPILLSGRPIASGQRDDKQSGMTLSLLDPQESVDSLLTRSDIELAHLALAQFRSLFVSDLHGRGSLKPRVSVVLSTNRPELVQSAVDRICSQLHVEVDLQIGLHGSRVDELGELNTSGGAIKSCNITEFNADVVFGDVLQALSASTSSSHIAKFDDDDHYGPHHLIDLFLSAALARSPLVGKAAEFVALEDASLLIRRRGGPPFTASRFLAGGALLMSRDALMKIGGWGQVRRGVDQDLISRFEANGLATFRTHGYEFVHVRHRASHTWEASNDYFINAASNIWSLDALATTGVTLDGSAPPPHTTLSRAHSRVSAALCVPNMNNQDSVTLFERRCQAYTRPIDLIVCDDRSDPPLKRNDEQAPSQIIRAPDGVGFGAGRSRHHAAASSTADVLVFADADMSISDEALSTILRQFDDGFVGAIHAAVDFSNIDISRALTISERYGFDNLASELKETQIPGQLWRERHWAASADLRQPRSSTFRATVGAFIAIDRASYERAGGFRDVVVRGVEDTEFGYRLLASGCEQRLYRGNGIVHLGERTFSQDLDSDESSQREIHLSAFVPIWNRTLSERRASLATWVRPVIPFAMAVSDCCKEQMERVCEEFGESALVTASTSSWDYLSTPFALCYQLDTAGPQATTRAHSAFRNSRCGDVVVVDQGREIARFVALWALNVTRVRQHERPLEGTDINAPVAASTLAALRRDFESAIVSI